MIRTTLMGLPGGQPDPTYLSGSSNLNTIYTPIGKGDGAILPRHTYVQALSSRLSSPPLFFLIINSYRMVNPGRHVQSQLCKPTSSMVQKGWLRPFLEARHRRVWETVSSWTGKETNTTSFSQ